MKLFTAKRVLAVMLTPVVGCALFVGSILLGLEPQAGPADRAVEEATLRKTTAGEIVGFRSAVGMDVWSGIPYAASVAGERRWTMPAKPGGWEGRREFVAEPQPCIQFGPPFKKLPRAGFFGVEDCLTLDVMAPAGLDPDGGAKLPVMFWIHGGGETLGAPGNLDRNLLVPEQKVILVGVRYRLGPFGFFSHEAARAEGTQTANFALEDLILALQWVRENIAAFGGDPDNVTIFGESAGARNVFSLMLSPRAKGLFAKAVMQSGASTTVPAMEAEAPATAGGAANNSADIVAKLLVRMKKAEDADAARALATAMSPQELMAFLRSTPALDLISVYQKTPKDRMYAIPSAIRDGFTLPKAAPEDVMADPAQFNDAPIMLGTNRDELSMLLLSSRRYAEPDLFRIPRIKDKEKFKQVSDAMALIFKYAGADRIANWLAADGGAPVFVYRFDWRGEPTIAGFDAGEYIGAAHTFEIPFVFGQFEDMSIPRFFLTKKNAADREKLSRIMRAYWAEFARAGNPGGADDNPPWPQWTRSAPTTFLLDLVEDGGLRPIEGSQTRASIEAAVAADGLNAADRCALYNLMLASQVWSKADIARLDDGGACG